MKEKCNLYPLIIIMSVLFFTSTYLLIQPLLAYVMSTYPEVDPTTVKLCTTLPSLLALIITPLFSGLTLKVRKKVLVGLTPVAVICESLIFIFFGTKGFIFCLIGTAFAAIVQGTGNVLMYAYLTDFCETADESTKWLGIYNALYAGSAYLFMNLGGKIGAMNAGKNWGNAYWLFLAGVPFFILYIIKVPRLSPAEERNGIGRNVKKNAGTSFKGIAQLPKIILVMAFLEMAYYWVAAAYTTNISQLIIRELELGTSAQSGNASGLYRLGGFTLGILVGFIAPRLKRMQIPVFVGCVCLGQFLIIGMRTIPFIYLGSFIAGFGNQGCYLTAFSSAMAYAGSKYKGIATGALQWFCSIGTFTAPYVLPAVGKLFKIGGNPSSQLTVSMFIGLCCIILMTLVYTIYPRYHVPQGAE